MRDQPTVNNTAIKILKIVYTLLIEIGCFLHTIDHASEDFVTPNLSEFVGN